MIAKVKQWIHEHSIGLIVFGYLVFCAFMFWAMVIVPSPEESAEKECEAAGGVWLNGNSQCFNKEINR